MKLKNSYHIPGFRLEREIGASSMDNSKKGKAVPLQAESGPEGSRQLRFPDFMTTA